MICLLVADLHYDLRKFDWVVTAAVHADLVVLAGDHLDLASSVDRPAQAVVVQRYFRKIRALSELIVSSGNHDLDSCDAQGEFQTRWVTKSRYFGVPTDGDSTLIGDCRFTICPWSQSRLTEKTIDGLFARDALLRADRWFWIYHAPPAGSPTSFDGKRSWGDRGLRCAIERYQPDYVLCGHVHQSPFVEKGAWIDRIGQSWVFNAGHQIGPVPSHIFIDTDVAEAFWISWEGVERASLDTRGSISAAALPLQQAPPKWLERSLRSMHA